MAKKTQNSGTRTPKSKPTTYTPKNIPSKRDSSAGAARDTPVPRTVSGRPPKKT